jgi:hypothetical protein
MAAANGITLKRLFAQALEDRLRRAGPSGRSAQPPWMRGFGGLADLRAESRRLLKLVDAEFEQVDPEDPA